MTTVVTGAAGHVGQVLLPRLADRDLRLVDRRPVAGGLTGDLTDRGFLHEVLDGASAVVHLAANPAASAAWDDLCGPNVDAVTAVLEVSAQRHVPKVVLASSVHAAGVYVLDGMTPVDPRWPPAPCCVYGATKAYAEALARSFVHRANMSVICLRLGAVVQIPDRTVLLPSWLAPDDLGQLVGNALDSAATYGVYHGVSANTRAQFALINDIGYRPVHNSERFADTADVDPGRSGFCRGAPGPIDS